MRLSPTASLSLLVSIIVVTCSVVAHAADSLNLTFRYDDPGKQQIRVYVPADFNNWGSNINGEIAIDDTSRMWYNDTGQYWWKTYRFAVGDTHAYKFHFHLDSSGTSWQWISDPLNPVLDNSGFNNSLITIADPMIFEPRVKRDGSGHLIEVRAGIDGSSALTSLVLISTGDTTDLLPYFDPARRIVIYPLPSPLQAQSLTLSATDALARTVTYNWLAPPPPSGLPWENEVFYQIFPRSFYDSDGDSIGDFNGMAQKLDYLQQLGVTALWLNPISRSHAYHNYFADNFDSTDNEFGSNADFINLVKAVHARGMKIFIDMESQYISSYHLWYVDSYNNPSSPYSQYIWYNGPNNTNPESFTLFSYDGLQIPVITLKMSTPAHVAYQKQMYARWVDPNGDGVFDDGVDGFRIDHIMDNLDYKNENTNLFATFWHPLFDTLRTINPDVFFLCEQANWADYGTTTLTGSGADAVFGIPLMFGIRSWNKSNILGQISATISAIPAGNHVFTIIENHDVDRFASVVGGSIPEEKIGAALNLLLPGVPCIYYGQEIGMKGTRGNWGSDGNDIPVREAMEWHATRAGAGMAFWYNNGGPWWTNSSVHDNDGISVEEQQGDSTSLWSYYHKLITLRKSHPAFRAGTYVTVYNDNGNVLSFGRQNTGDSAEMVLVIANLAASAQSANVNVTSLTGAPPSPVGVIDMVGSRTFPDVTSSNASAYPISLGANEVVVVKFMTASVTNGVKSGWNMLSLPFSVTDGRKTALFPQAGSNAFMYAGTSYHVVDTLRTGRGFWLRFDSALTVEFHGSDRFTDTIPVQAGWNMIGALSTPVPVSSVQSIPGGLVTSPFYTYASDYAIVDTLTPGNGYWVRSSAAAALVLNSSPANLPSGAVRIADDGELPPPPPAITGVTQPGTPRFFRLYQNYPNPFNPSTTIRFDVPADAKVTLTIYNLFGEEIATLLRNAPLGAGYREIPFNAQALASGVYFYRMTAEPISITSAPPSGTFTSVKKMMLLK